MAARCTTPPVAMHHSSGNDAPSSAVRLHFLCGVCSKPRIYTERYEFILSYIINNSQGAPQQTSDCITDSWKLGTKCLCNKPANFHRNYITRRYNQCIYEIHSHFLSRHFSCGNHYTVLNCPKHNRNDYTNECWIRIFERLTKHAILKSHLDTISNRAS